MFRNTRIVPALMFHSVGLQDHAWAWSYISESLEQFEGKIVRLAKAGYRAVFWEELYEYMAGRRHLPGNSILLTFDDGYLDNWVYVYPILRKYGMKGTIFVSPDFVDPGTEVRPNLDDARAGRCAGSELQVPGFLNWAEMRAMEASGVMDVQSHAMTHTWYFTQSEIVGFHRPHAVTPYPWLFWNARPERKPYYLNEDQQGYLPWGYPIFANQKSLVARQFFPDETAVDRVTGFVAERGGRRFFDDAEWEAKLRQWIDEAFGKGGLPGTFESEEARMVRITEEVRSSKELIERNLGKAVQFICWPGGANDEAVHKIAREVGYKSWTLDSRSQLDKRNLPGTDPSSIKRIGTSSRIGVKGKVYGAGGARYQLWRILEHQGSLGHAGLIKTCKAAALAWHAVGGRS